MECEIQHQEHTMQTIGIILLFIFYQYKSYVLPKQYSLQHGTAKVNYYSNLLVLDVKHLCAFKIVIKKMFS